MAGPGLPTGLRRGHLSELRTHARVEDDVDVLWGRRIINRALNKLRLLAGCGGVVDVYGDDLAEKVHRLNPLLPLPDSR